MDSQNQKRRWRPRFSLRALMIAMTVACIVLGWMGHRVHRARVQREAVAALKSVTMDIMYDWECDARDRAAIPGYRGEPAGPDWLRELIGGEYFQEVQEVCIEVDWNTDLAVLDHVADLPHAQTLVIVNQNNYAKPKDLDLRFLAHLRNLECLFVCELRVDDACIAQIGRRTSLRSLGLPSCVVRAESFQHLLNLPNLEKLALWSTRTDDAVLNTIGQMRTLKELNLSSTDITGDGLAALAELPLTKLELPDIELQIDDFDAFKRINQVLWIEVEERPFSSAEFESFSKQVPNVRFMDRNGIAFSATE